MKYILINGPILMTSFKAFLFDVLNIIIGT